MSDAPLRRPPLAIIDGTFGHQRMFELDHDQGDRMSFFSNIAQNEAQPIFV
jgi:hypothetical protein